LGLVDDQPFDADAILTSVLAKMQSAKCTAAERMMENTQNAAHPDADVSVEVGSRQDNSGVLSSQLQGQRGHVLSSSNRNLATNFLRSDKRDVFDDR
jgi:endonuclease/exonuclease/phosphatase (EEP) superfamily protein YafD